MVALITEERLLSRESVKIDSASLFSGKVSLTAYCVKMVITLRMEVLSVAVLSVVSECKLWLQVP